ncbi:MAG TPA: histidine phosphatase family protein [Rubrobacteraceae bacterium]|nr:histidine phosphatase family protein [Rubrobacteraceae bacterium]
MLERTDFDDCHTLLSTVRHGLTELNRDKRVGGRVDVPLIEEGRRQAREAHEGFDGTPFDVVISSPLSRALETAEIVAGINREEVVIDEGCTERSFGEMEGLRPHEVRERLPRVEYVRVGHVDYSLNPPGGETFEQLHERAREFLVRTLGAHGGRSVLLFAHENFLQQLHGVLRGLGPMESLEHAILNCELNRFCLDDDGSLVSHHRVELCASASDYPSF